MCRNAQVRFLILYENCFYPILSNEKINGFQILVKSKTILIKPGTILETPEIIRGFSFVNISHNGNDYICT
jgi:hypothetical protein